MSILLLGAAALLPSLLLVVYFHQRDVYPEPPGVLWRTFGLGILTVFPVLVVAWPLDGLIESIENPLLYGAAAAFFSAAIPEELFKFLVLWGYSARHMEFDEPMDGLVYGATASLGFATLENVLYVSEGGLGVALLRAVTAVPGHGFLGAIMGYFVGRALASQGRERRGLLWRALLIPTVLHGLYDTPLLAAARIDDPFASATGILVLLLLPMALAIVVGEAWWALRLVRRLRAEQLAVVPAAAFPRPAPPPGAGATTAPERRPAGTLVGWLLTLGGGGLVCVGGLVGLAVIVGLLLEEQSADDLFYGLIGGALIGGLPLVGGSVLFVAGIWRLNRVYRSAEPSNRQTRAVDGAGS